MTYESLMIIQTSDHSVFIPFNALHIGMDVLSYAKHVDRVKVMCAKCTRKGWYAGWQRHAKLLTPIVSTIKPLNLTNSNLAISSVKNSISNLSTRARVYVFRIFFSSSRISRVFRGSAYLFIRPLAGWWHRVNSRGYDSPLSINQFDRGSSVCSVCSVCIYPPHRWNIFFVNWTTTTGLYIILCCSSRCEMDELGY